MPTFKEITGKENISYAGRAIAAKNLAPEKQKIYPNALRKTIANPHYIVQEMAHKNVLTFLEGEELSARLKSSSDRDAEVKLWEIDRCEERPVGNPDPRRPNFSLIGKIS